jgi:hypothetical protein
VLPKNSVPVVRFFVGKGLNAKDIHKDIFPVCGGKCLSRKGVQNWIKKFSQGRSKVADDARKLTEVAETTFERLLCCGFRRTGKVMEHGYHCWWRICREINVFFSSFEYHMFYVLYAIVTYLLTLPRMRTAKGAERFLNFPSLQTTRTVRGPTEV